MVLTLLCWSTALGLLFQFQLLKPSTETETLNFMNVIITFVLTISAVVIGLLINTAMSFVDTTKHHWAMYAGQLTRLDQSLRNYGLGAEPIRKQLQSFTAGAIANFWQAEELPTEVNGPDVRNISRDDARQVLGGLLNQIKLGIIGLNPSDPLHERLAADCLDQYREFARARWSLVLEPESSLPAPFFRMLITWLMIIFLCFGLRAPANPVVLIMIALSAATLSSMVFIILDMVNPYEGRYNLSSSTMRNALNIMIREDAVHKK